MTVKLAHKKVIVQLILFFIFILFSQKYCSANQGVEKEIAKIHEFTPTYPDSAIQRLKSIQSSTHKLTDKHQIQINQELGFAMYYKRNYSKAKSYFEKALTISKKSKDSLFLGKVLNNLGIIAFRMGEYDKAIDYYHKSLELKKRQNDSVQVAYTLQNIGNIYNREGYYISATKYYYQSIKIFDQFNLDYQKAVVLQNLGTCQKAREEYIKADSSYQKALVIFKNLNKQTGVLTVLNNIGVIRMVKKQYKKAKSIFNEIILLASELNDSLSLAYGYNNKGEIALVENKLEIAATNLYKAKKLFRVYGDKSSKININKLIGILLFKQGNKTKGLALMDSTFNKLKALKSYDLAIETGNQLGYYLEKNGNYKKSLYILQQVNKLDAKFHKIRRTTITKDIEAKHHYEKLANLYKISERETQILKAKNRLQKSKILLSIYIFIGVTLILILLFWFLMYRNKQKSKILNLEIESKNNELTRLALHISEKKRLLQGIGEDIKTAKNKDENKKIYTRISSIIQADKESDHFFQEVNQFLSQFRSTLLSYFDDLKEKDLRLCALIHLGLSSKEIANIFNISAKSVDMRRYRLRKKVNIPTNQSIEQWLQEIYDKN